MRTPCVAGWHRTPRFCLRLPLLSVTYVMISFGNRFAFSSRVIQRTEAWWRHKRGQMTWFIQAINNTYTRPAVLLVLLAHAGALLAQTAQQQAWDILRAGVNQKSTGKRTQAVRALRLLPGDPEATKMAQMALQDRKPEVRAAAATALGLMGSNESIPELKNALSDRKPAVALAAAHALQLLNDPAGYQVYYDVLTGERKSADGLVAQQMQTLKDGRKMAELGFEEGLGFIPFADIGVSAVKAARKDDTSPVRAAAARALVNDVDPRVGQALVQAASDKNWIVRASALLAIAKRGDPEFLNAIVLALSDKNGVVRCTAAAAVIRLTTVAERNKDVKAASNALGGELKYRQTHSEAPVAGMVGSNAFGETPTNQTKQ
jgi:HEAT repeat protein